MSQIRRIYSIIFGILFGLSIGTIITHYRTLEIVNKCDLMASVQKKCKYLPSILIVSFLNRFYFIWVCLHFPHRLCVKKIKYLLSNISYLLSIWGNTNLCDLMKWIPRGIEEIPYIPSPPDKPRVQKFCYVVLTYSFCILSVLPLTWRDKMRIWISDLQSVDEINSTCHIKDLDKQIAKTIAAMEDIKMEFKMRNSTQFNSVKPPKRNQK